MTSSRPLVIPTNTDSAKGRGLPSTTVESNEHVEPFDAEDALSGELPSKEGRGTPGGWTQYKKQMDRLTTAVRRAIALSEDESDLHGDNDPAQAQAIVFSANDGQAYRIPWDACRTWRKRMETFLQEWFSEDESSLQALASGNFTIGNAFFGAIPPGLWESVVQPDSRLDFSHQLPPEAPPPLPPVQNVEADALTETSYENRIQYKVTHYRRQQFGGRSEFVSQNTYTEPIELDVQTEHERLPVLEERKTVESPPDTTARTKEFALNPPKKSSDKLTKLRESDWVSEPELKIHSPYLLNVIKSVVECSAELPAGDNQGLDAGLFAYPYMDLYLHLDDILRYKSKTSELRKRHTEVFNRFADEHIDLLQTYLESQPTIQYKEAVARSSSSVSRTTFGTFWLLMKPGTDVYVRETDGSLNRYVLDRLSGGKFKDSRGNQVTVKYTAQVWNLILDNKAIHQYTRQIDVQVFDDERLITELPVFPVQYHDDHDGGALRKDLIARGRKYLAYAKSPCFLQYEGQGLKPGSRSYKRARVVVEHASSPWSEGAIWGSTLDHHMPTRKASDTAVPVRMPTSSPFGLPPPPPPPPSKGSPIVGESLRVASCECKDCQKQASSKETYLRLKFSDYKEIDPTKEPELTEHQYSIMPSHMFAFILNDRAYDLLDVAKLQEPSMAEKAIDRLVMREGNKNLIKAIAKTYTDSSPRFKADFIYGKGEGQIILLHGPPGTGKTLTAVVESVAEFTGRPLLNITAADLGHEPEGLEKSLLQYFRRANDWDAIVLLDEADVYLEKRSKNDLQRNSIVSVFLRALDYFQGILFLTTNRINQFDEAFKSRIHLSLGYDKLNDDARAQIWGNLFQKLRDDHKHGGPEIGYDKYAKRYVTQDEEVLALEWNGREIRNAFQTAVALAVYDAKHDGQNKNSSEPAIPEVTEDHLKQVVMMSSAFRKYMRAANENMDDSDLAFKEGNRDDRTSSAPSK
ncbi:hypothetical protein E8E12_009103 [Didymella heteroderae]|uniref:AAA+ ATPase domain-containing protein n=1 Tax=Didymella heteroderae TaxID=1769908 RepID=A0A9P4WRK4_9PLEO|nr:hypothetical protein E8E12_009103 [Didymella heteroderae]